MKLDRIIWGIILLFIGVVLLLENFNVIEFYWRNVWGFWPIFLIIAGVNILFNRNKSNVGNMISIGIVVITMGFLFYKGQQPPQNRHWFSDNFGNDINIDVDTDNEDSNRNERLNFSESYVADSAKKVLLNISGGGTSFELNGATDSLITADVEKSRGTFTMKKEYLDSIQTITFKMQNKKGKWNMSEGGNDVDFKLNTAPEWDVVMNMGAGEVNFDFTDYKVRKFKFDGGAAALDITMGDMLPIADVIVKTGVADVKIKVPSTAGCRIKSSTGLSAKDFTGFTKMENGSYETPNYASSTKKIFITLDGGLSNFEVSRY